MHIVYCGPFEPDQFLDRNEVADIPTGHGGFGNVALIKGLIEAGVTVTAISTSPNISSEWKATQGNLTLHLVPSRSRALHRALDLFAREKKELRSAIGAANGDLIHAHWTYEFALAALKIDRRSLITVHDAPLSILRHNRQLYRVFRLLMAIHVRFLMKNATYVSPYLRDRWRREMFWFKKSPIVHNIAPLLVTHEHRFKINEFQIVATGDGSRRKNIRTLLEAWPLIKDAIPTATLHLVGEGLEVDSELYEFAQINLFNRDVTWHGFISRTELQKVLSSSQLLIHPSLEESTGLILLEAMLLNLPTIVGDPSGAAKWTVGSGGLTVNVKNPKSIAQGAVNLLQNQAQIAELSKLGRIRAQTSFDRECIVREYIGLYKKILGGTEV